MKKFKNIKLGNQILKPKRALRSSQGVYLVEILVALLVGAMLTFALLDIAAISMRHASSTQNEIIANTIVRELLDATRATNYKELRDNAGEYNLITNKITESDVGPTIREFPLQLDVVEKSWENASQNSRFRGDVKYIIENQPDESEKLRVTVSVSWSDSQHYGSSNSGRKISKSIIIFKNGANAWNSVDVQN